MPRLDPIAVFASLCALTGAPMPALATWPNDPTNGNLPLCIAPYEQIAPAIVSDGAGGAIVAWADSRDVGSWDVYAQRVDASGTPLWTVDGVALCAAPGDQLNPTIVSDEAGGAIVAWEDSRSGSPDIYAQRVSAAGVPQWAADGVALCAGANGQDSPRMIEDGAGGAIVTWQDRRGSDQDVFAQRVSAAGAALWSADGVPICVATGDQYLPKIAADGASGAIVTWMDPRAGGFDIYAQRVDAAGATPWVAGGVGLCTAGGTQSSPTIVSDGAGGAIVVWFDYRNGNADVYAQRVSAGGSPAWPSADGVPISAATGGQYYPKIASDAAGGAIVAWEDYRDGTDRIFAQRIVATGSPQWLANGVALDTAPGGGATPAISSDGAGGALVSWEDYRAGSSADIYAQRLDASGTAQWTADGMVLSSAASDQLGPAIASDGSGGAIVAWYDYRNDTDANIYAQRVEGFGYLGNPEPGTVTVSDVPNDQGGMVQLTWSASYLDAAPYNVVTEYGIWESASAAASGARRSRFLSPAASGSWIYVGAQPASQQPSYSYLVATSSDSTAASSALVTFMIEARTPSGSQYWYSAPVSGHSVDNLAPSAPAPFTAAYLAGGTHLHWGGNPESDLAGYRLYRGSSSSFSPGPDNLIRAQPDTGYVDAGPAGSWYKLAAIDIHGNESPFSVLGTDGTVAVPAAVAITELFFDAPSPNPTSFGATFHFGLPREGRVTLALFDQQGRRVRELVHGLLPAGDHRATWDGRDQEGRPVPSGLYFARLDHAGLHRVERLIAMR